jgi:hypothetical protein
MVDMLTLNQPPLTQHISIPKDMSQLSVEAFTAGIVEGVLDALDVVRRLASLYGRALIIAGEGYSAYSGNGSVPAAYCYPDQARSKSHGPGRSVGKVVHLHVLYHNIDENNMTTSKLDHTVMRRHNRWLEVGGATVSL